MPDVIPLVHVFVDHSNIWGGARLASRIKAPTIDDSRARLSVKALDRVLLKKRRGVMLKIVSGGIPPGMEAVWIEYQRAGYDTQRLIRDTNWKERGVDHSLIGHMWKIVATQQNAPIVLVLASGDGKKNECNTSFSEVIAEVLTHTRFSKWKVELASFHWTGKSVLSPTNRRMMEMVKGSERGESVNLFDDYSDLVYHEAP